MLGQNTPEYISSYERDDYKVCLVKLPFLTNPYKLFAYDKETKTVVFECYLKKVPLVWNLRCCIYDGKGFEFLLFVEEPDKIKVVNLDEQEKRVIELLLPEGVRVKCSGLLSNEL